jgi:SlyX protein
MQQNERQENNSQEYSQQERYQQEKYQQDIEHLQMKVAYQEDTIETLSNALADQQKQLDQMAFQLRHVVEKLKQVQPSNIADASQEPPPPHY